MKTNKKIDLIRRIKEINRCVPDNLLQYTDCFGKIGCLKEKRHIVVDAEVSPVINPLSGISASLEIKLNEELDRIVKIEIIIPIEGPTGGVSSLVIVETPHGELRIYFDPRLLNQAILNINIS